MVVRTLGAKADPVQDRIVADGQVVTRPRRLRTVVLHKPRGVVTTLADPEGRPSIGTLVSEAQVRLFPVGRLDLQTSGVLLLTNDGALAAGLAHPRRQVPRVYRAKVSGSPTTATLRRLRTGIHLDDGRAALDAVRVVSTLPNKTWIECTVHAGRWRLVRRIFSTVGHPVDKLERVRFGPIALGHLPPGAWRDVTPAELALLREAAGLTAVRTPVGTAAHRGRDKRPRTPAPPRARPRAAAPHSAGPARAAAGNGRRAGRPRGRPRP